MTAKTSTFDATTREIVQHLVHKHKCHTVVVYGSRARGNATASSDYDVFGITDHSKTIRLAKYKNKIYWDVFVYHVDDFLELNDFRLMSFSDAIVVVDKAGYGKKVLKLIRSVTQAPYKRLPKDEILALKVWAQKQMDRCRVGDTHGLYRRTEFHFALVEHYFNIRHKRFWGPKAGIQWMKENDPKIYKLLRDSLKYPSNLKKLGLAAEATYKTKLSY